MHHRNALILFAGVTCCALLSSSVDAQITEAVQKLLPATVAVELKAERPVPKTGDQSQNEPPSELPEKQVLQETQAAERELELVLQALDSQQQLEAGGEAVDAVSYATGTIVSTDGLIVTTLGSEGGNLKVTFNNGKEMPAKLVAADRRSGLQLLKVDSDGLPTVELSAGDILLGEQVATVVCTDVSDRAAATGIITATDRTVGELAVELLQTDVQIGPMSAGAPLANLHGEVIGIFVAKESDTGGRSFAVPVKYVRELLQSHRGAEAVILERGFLGVQLNDDEEAVDAPYVIQVIDDSPAEKAGFKEGDTIIKIDDEATATPKQVVRIIGRHKAGDQVEITSVREGKTRELKVTLDAYPKRPVLEYKQAIQLFHPGHVVTAGKDGKIKIWKADSETGGIQVQLAEPQQAKPPLTEDQYKALLESYNRALQAQSQIGTILRQPAIRVERSDVEKQLGELTERVKSLQAEVEKLTEELKDVGEKLSDE